MKNMNELAKFICSLEGKKSQVSIGDVKELLGIIGDLMYANPEVHNLIMKNGRRRVNKLVRNCS